MVGVSERPGPSKRPRIAGELGASRVLVFDSATYVQGHFAEKPASGDDVIVSASYAGVYCAKLVAPYGRRGAIGVDCNIGKDGAGIAGLWYYEALDIPAAAAGVATVELGNGADLYESGVISRVNGPAEAVGVRPGQTVEVAAALMLRGERESRVPGEVPRWVVEQGDDDGDVVCIDSIADASLEDRDRNVLCTAGHTGRSVVIYIRRFHPRGFICSDGGGAKNDSGLSALWDVDDEIPGAAVDAMTARMGDGRSTYYDGIVSACNAAAGRCGVRARMPATEAAHLMLVGSADQGPATQDDHD